MEYSLLASRILIVLLFLNSLNKIAGRAEYEIYSYFNKRSLDDVWRILLK